MSPLTHLYLAFSQVSGPVWRLIHRKRLKKGKEVTDRLPEKYGEYRTDRPGGEVLWFHALSVGESLALVPLIECALRDRPDSHVVLTTSTVTSIAALDGAGLSDGVTHVMLPIDTAQAVKRFLSHWSPSFAVFAELDFWPRLMIETHRRGIPMVLVNSRMSEKSFASRSKTRGMTRDVLRLFADLLLQDEDSVDRFVALGAPRDRVSVVGALKAAARPLVTDAEALDALRMRLGATPVWLAAATHPAEEAKVIEAHKAVRAVHPGALLIIAPRYPDRADALEALAKAAFSEVGRRSKGDDVNPAGQVYIADTIGEMGLWYRVAPVSFVGHSMSDTDGVGGGGKNPYEAMALGSAVVHGPDVSDFAETYALLLRVGASHEVRTSQELGEAVSRLLATEARADMLDEAEGVIEERRSVLDATWSVLNRHLR